jgi:hypothetical protein
MTNFDEDGLTNVYEGTWVEWINGDYSRTSWRLSADVFAVEISCLEGMVCEACRTINTTIRNARA